MTNNLTVVMLVGGRGSRLVPYTDKTPKCLIDVAGKTLLERILDNLQPLFTGFTVNYVFLVNYLGKQVEEFVTKNLDLDAVFLYDKPDADQVSVVLEAKPFVTGAMLLYYGDTVIFTDMQYLPDYSFFYTDHVDDVSGYGCIGENGRIIEKPSWKTETSGWVFVGGVFIANPTAFYKRLIKSNRYYLSEAIDTVLQKKVSSHISIDDIEDWVMANKYYKENEK